MTTKAIINRGTVRRAAEIVLGPLVFSRRLPAGSGGGLIRVSPRVGGLKFLFKSADRWDPELLEMARVLVASNASVWDVGANIGLFSRAAAFHAGVNGSILSIEADLDVIKLLDITASRNSVQAARITVLPVAIADRVGILRFAIARRARAANAIDGFGSSQTGGVSAIRTLPCMTLDSLLPHFPAPHVLKIDVEGAEMLVLSGAKQVLEETRPRIYCEVSAKTRDAVSAMLSEHGYSVWDSSGYAGGKRAKVSQTTTNIVAIP